MNYIARCSFVMITSLMLLSANAQVNGGGDSVAAPVVNLNIGAMVELRRVLNLNPTATRDQIGERYQVEASQLQNSIQTQAGGSPEWHLNNLNLLYKAAFRVQQVPSLNLRAFRSGKYGQQPFNPAPLQIDLPYGERAIAELMAKYGIEYKSGYTDFRDDKGNLWKNEGTSLRWAGRTTESSCVLHLLPLK